MVAPALLRGRQEPRLHLVPEAVSNAADDAIAIYEHAGGVLDPWQGLCVRTGCGERADGLWAAFEVGIIAQRQNGKGAPLEAVCMASLFVWNSGAKDVTIYSAHRGDTVATMFRRIKYLIENTPDLARRCKPINPSDEGIELITGARLEFRTRTRSGGRGLTGDLVILDEALELNAEQIAALVPVLLARPHAQLWYASTVPEFGDQHLCTVRARVLAGAERLAWAEWGVDRYQPDGTLTDLDDPQVIAQSNPALGIRITLERIRDLRAILGEEKWGTECHGIWPSTSAGGALDGARWKTMVDAASKRAEGSDVALAVDVTPMLDWGTIGLYGVREDGLEHMQLVDYRPGVDWIPARMAELVATLDPLGIAVIEKNGAYQMLLDAGFTPPEDPEEPRRGDLMVLRSQETARRASPPIPGSPQPAGPNERRAASGTVARAVGDFIAGFRRDPATYRHVGQEPLDRAVENVQARPIGDDGQIGWARRKSTVNIGPVVTVTCARFLFLAWHAVINSEYDMLASIPQVEGQCPHCDAWSLDGPIVHYEDCVTLREVPAGA